MIDVALHILGAALMMGVVFLRSTPLPIAFPWAAAVCLFWFGREWLQSSAPVTDWSGWKLAEAIAPCVTALICAIGVTVWRLMTPRKT